MGPVAGVRKCRVQTRLCAYREDDLRHVGAAMNRITAFLVSAAAVLSACDDRGHSRSPVGPTESVGFEARGAVFGSKIIFATDRDGPDPAGNFGNQEIYVMNADGTDQRRLTDNGAIDGVPAWSPNGQRIAFHSTRANPGPPPLAIDIFLMNADGTDQTQLTNLTTLGLGGAVDPVWSPDGQRIVFSSFAAPREVFAINVDGTGLTNLTNHPARDADPDWSPNGREIAFTSTRDGNREIYVMNADGSEPRRLTLDAAEDTRPCWSPDGKQIVFDRRVETGHFEVFVMNADGTNQTRLTTSPPGAFSGFASWGQGRAQMEVAP